MPYEAIQQTPKNVTPGPASGHACSTKCDDYWNDTLSTKLPGYIIITPLMDMTIVADIVSRPIQQFQSNRQTHPSSHMIFVLESLRT